MSVIIFSGGLHEKDPSDSIMYYFDWDYFEPLGTGVQISSVVHTIAGPDASLVKVTDSYSDRATLIQLSGGTVGNAYTVSSKVTTNETTPQTIERSFKVYVRQR